MIHDRLHERSMGMRVARQFAPRLEAASGRSLDQQETIQLLQQQGETSARGDMPMNGDLCIPVIIRFPGPFVRRASCRSTCVSSGVARWTCSCAVTDSIASRNRYSPSRSSCDSSRTRAVCVPVSPASLHFKRRIASTTGIRAAPQLPCQAALRQPLTGDQLTAGKHQADAPVGEIGCGFGC